MSEKNLSNEELFKMERMAREDRAGKLRILADIILDKFEATVSFEQHNSQKTDVVASFVVFHEDKSVEAKANAFVKAALPKIGFPISWENRDVIDIPVRGEPAAAHEKLQMLRMLRLNTEDHAEWLEKFTEAMGRPGPDEEAFFESLRNLDHDESHETPPAKR